MPIHVTFPRLSCRSIAPAFSVETAAKVIATFDDDDEDANSKTMVKKVEEKERTSSYRSQLASIGAKPRVRKIDTIKDELQRPGE